MAMPVEARTEQAALQEIGSRLSKINESLSMAVDRTQRVLDRAFGGSPVAGAQVASAPRPVPSGELGAINDRLNDIENLSAEQATILNRLDKIV